MQAATKTTPAALGGEAAVTIPAPGWPGWDQDDTERMKEVVQSGKWSWLGPNEMAFSKAYAEFIGTKYCICLSNGTVTLQCALQAAGVEPGHEVIVPGLTWVATAQAAMDIGANVVLVDIDPQTMCIDPDAIRTAITSRTKAIIPVHLYGCMCDMDAILQIAEEHDLKVIEDVAHQHGSQWRGTSAGALGDAGSYSFQQSKVLTSGEGGAITTNDEEIYRIAFALKQVGQMPDPEEPYVPGESPRLVPGNHYGHNYRITEMQAALLRGGLSRLGEETKRREETAARLAEKLARIGGPLQAAPRDERVTRQAYYCMSLLFDPAAAGMPRGMYLKAARAEGAGLGTPYPPVYRNKLLNLYDRTSPIPFRDPGAVQNYAELKLPNTEKVCDQTGVVMAHQHLLGSDAYIDQVAEAAAKVNDNLPALRKHFEAEEAAES